MPQRLTIGFLTSCIMAIGLFTGACLGAAASTQTPKAAASGCNPAEASSASQQTSTPTPPQEPAPAYVVGRTDTLNITVEPEIVQLESQKCSKDYTIGVDGKINFCQLQAISIEGLTEREIEAKIKKEFVDRKIWTGPLNVTAQVTKHRSQTVYVSGEVRTPGEQTLDGGELTLMHAITSAGGFTPNSGSDVYVLRPKRPAGAAAGAPTQVSPDDTNAERIHYSKKNLMTNFEQDPPVQAGDTIWVTQAEQFFINGEVKSGGMKAFEPCMSLGDAIAMAGGLTDKASLRRSYIQRKNAKGAFDQIGGLKLETLIQPRDNILIRRSLF